jgi:hypothetical protein
MKPQTENIMLLLIERQERGITALDALREEGCLRLASRIHELRKEGLDITKTTESTPNGKQIARYVLVPPVQSGLWP